MVLGRPKGDSSPQKYETSYRLFQLSRPRLEDGGTAVEELTAFLEWVVEQGDAGFREGDFINVSALAKGVRRSRNTAGKAVDALVTKGMLVQQKPKSPYQIVAQRPVFEDTGVVADAHISLTLKFDAPSRITRVGECRLLRRRRGGKRDPIAEFLRTELAGSRDQLVQEAAASYWQEGTFQYYLRLRTVEVAGGPTGALLEITYLHLPPGAARTFRAGVGSLRDHHVTQISLYPLLEECGLSDVRSGRSHVTVAATPPLLTAELKRSVDTGGVDMSAFGGERSLLKWTYGIFHPEACPMVTFSVCYVRADLLNIFIRNLDVEFGAPG